MQCPKCGAEMREKSGRYGRFRGCPNWPRCNGTRDLKPTDNWLFSQLSGWKIACDGLETPGFPGFSGFPSMQEFGWIF